MCKGPGVTGLRTEKKQRVGGRARSPGRMGRVALKDNKGPDSLGTEDHVME